MRRRTQRFPLSDRISPTLRPAGAGPSSDNGPCESIEPSDLETERITHLLGVNTLLYGVSNRGHTYIVRYAPDNSAYWFLHVPNLAT